MSEENKPTLVSTRTTSGGGNALSSDEKILGKTLNKTLRLTSEELHLVNTRKGLIELLSSKHVNIDKALVKLRYERELERLQIEFVKLQRAVQLSGRRVALIFEGKSEERTVLSPDPDVVVRFHRSNHSLD